MAEQTKKGAADEAAVLAKIAEFPKSQRAIGERIHEIILDTVSDLRPKLFYGMPGYAKDGPVLVFFRVDDGVMSLGISEKATIAVEDGAPDQLVESAWFVSGIDESTEKRIVAIVRRAAG